MMHINSNDNAIRKRFVPIITGTVGALIVAVVLLLFLVVSRQLRPKGELLAYREMDTIEETVSTIPVPPPPTLPEPVTPPPTPPIEMQQPLPKLELSINPEAPSLLVTEERRELEIEMKEVEFRKLQKAPPPQKVVQQPTPTKSYTKQPPQKAQNFYSAQHLDSQPRLINRPSVTYPWKLKVKGYNQGKVTLEVMISASGRVTVRKILAATHPDFIPMARSFAARARFTAPRKNGKAVNAVFNWPLVLKP